MYNLVLLEKRYRLPYPWAFVCSFPGIGVLLAMMKGQHLKIQDKDEVKLVGYHKRGELLSDLVFQDCQLLDHANAVPASELENC